MDPYTFIKMLMARRQAQARGIQPPAPPSFTPSGPGAYGRAGGVTGPRVLTAAPIESRTLMDRPVMDVTMKAPGINGPVTSYAPSPGPFPITGGSPGPIPNLDLPPPMSAPQMPASSGGSGGLPPSGPPMVPPQLMSGTAMPPMQTPYQGPVPSGNIPPPLVQPPLPNESDLNALSAGRHQMIVDQIMKQKASRDALFARYGNLMRPEWSRDF